MEAPKAHETVPRRVHHVALTKPNAVAVYSKDDRKVYRPLHFGELWAEVRALGVALQELGVGRGEHVGMMSDNRREWLQTDLALLSIGAADVPRGSDSTADEMGYILAHADCRLCFAENPKQLEKILSQKDRLPKLETIVLFDAEDTEDETEQEGVRIRRFDALRARGHELVSERGADFQAAGIKLLEGYGLTETGPVLAVRHQHHPVPGTVGRLLPDIEYRVLDENKEPLPPGHKGVLHVRSPQIMEGYYKKPEQTQEVLTDGWLDTGDIVVFTHSGEFTILGRAKETIVLLGGENIEPVPIEEKLLQSELIDQAMVVGQDQKFLGALIDPNDEALQQYLEEQGVQYVDREGALENPQVHERFHEEINSQVNPKTGFKSFERIFRFTLLPKHFEVGRELTQTLKIRRSVVHDLYVEQISSLFA